MPLEFWSSVHKAGANKYAEVKDQIERDPPAFPIVIETQERVLCLCCEDVGEQQTTVFGKPRRYIHQTLGIDTWRDGGTLVDLYTNLVADGLLTPHPPQMLASQVWRRSARR